MQLVVAEKPSVARDLARVLGVVPRGEHAFEGAQHVITWCVGHLVELDEPAAYDPKWRAWRLDALPMLPAEFRLRPAKHAAAQLRAVAQLLRERRFASVVNACDAGREGELIFRYVHQWAGGGPRVQRLWISSLTDDAIRRGFAGLRDGARFDALGDAARSRSEADWLVGMNATRAITARGREAGQAVLYSIGRVQTPTLAMLVGREREIRAFVPRPYWLVRGAFATAAGERFGAGWRYGGAARLGAAALAEAVCARATAAAVVEKVRAKVVREPPPLLFDLTALQRTANKRFGFSAARTLEIAQLLYERHKVLTYPRTDARYLTTDVAATLPALFAALEAAPAYAAFAAELVARPRRPGRRVVDDAKVHDHHAIIPTGKLAASLGRDEARIFDLVARRFLGAFFPDAEIAMTDVLIRAGADGPLPPRAAEGDEAPILEALPPPPDRFVARGRVRIAAGWQAVAGIGERDSRDGEDAGALPVLSEGQVLTGRYAPVAKETAPPPRYTEATLLGAMESAGKAIDDEALRAAMRDTGLGTPATRAAIIETLLRREYVERAKQHLAPTALGMALVAALPVASLASPELTGQWEARLARIARGEDTRAAFMADIARYVEELVDAIRAAPPPAASPASSTPQKWGKGKRKRFGKRGGGAGARGRSWRAKGEAAKVPSTPRVAKPRRAPAPPAAAPDLVCPRCHTGALISGARGWGCARWREGCGFVIWFETAGKRLTASQLRDLVTRGKTRKGRFRSERGAPAEGRLVLDAAANGGSARFEPD